MVDLALFLTSLREYEDIQNETKLLKYDLGGRWRLPTYPGFSHHDVVTECGVGCNQDAIPSSEPIARRIVKRRMVCELISRVIRGSVYHIRWLAQTNSALLLLRMGTTYLILEEVVKIQKNAQGKYHFFNSALSSCSAIPSMFSIPRLLVVLTALLQAHQIALLDYLPSALDAATALETVLAFYPEFPNFRYR